MGAANLGVDDQRAPDRPRADHISGGLDAEGRAGTGDVHIKGKTARAQKLLDFHANRRIGAFHVGCGTDHQIDVGRIHTCGRQRLLRGIDADFRHVAGRVIGALWQARKHARGVHQARFIQHIALFDTGGGKDEIGRGMRFRGDSTGGYGIGVLRVPQVGMRVKGCDQFVIGDDLGRGENPRPGDGCLVHIRPRKFCATLGPGRLDCPPERSVRSALQ